MLNFSVSEENYIKSVYRLQTRNRTVSTSQLARELNTTPASVTDMMKKLKGKKLMHYQPYKGFRLTQDGTRVALGIVRRHRLWEYFLSEKLKFDWSEVHALAEDLEHICDKKLIDKLDEFLGYPKADPHGDPIPDATGKLDAASCFPLSGLQLHTTARVCYVQDQSGEMLELLRNKNIGIGSRLEVKKKYAYDGSLELKTGRYASSTISNQAASNIYVQLTGNGTT